MPSSPSEKAELLDAIALREAQLEAEKKHHALLRQNYSYEVRFFELSFFSNAQLPFS